MKNIFTLVLLLIACTAFSQTSDSSSYHFNKGIEEKTARRYLVASGYFDKAIALNPKYTAAYIENGLVNKEMRRTDAAKQNFIKAFDLDKSNEQVMAELLEIYFTYLQ